MKEDLLIDRKISRHYQEEWHDYRGSKKLKDGMKRHLYKVKYGNQAFENAHLWMDDYNPLTV